MSAGGELEGWVFGTIHSLPDGTDWRTDALERAVQDAEVLVVEVAGLEDGAAIAETFAELSYNDQTIPIRSRVPADRHETLEALLDEAGISSVQLIHSDTWAAALSLARVTGTGDPENGADRWLISAFSDRPALELEGAKAQLGIFDALPEKEQRDLLLLVLEEYERGKEPARDLAEAWRLGRIDEIEQAGRMGLLSDPELRDALLTQRNRAWAGKLDSIAKARPPMLVAVGAAHLPGEDGILTLLEQRGYSIRRIQ
ncbi:TraB/GumN family protein [Erythrobacter sp. HKB08]|uniref:TraB/GumN family protein n=1 Tax=Erythrobacter sp. HKB08 TaxID=2502843 RepID=UPI0013E89F7B|nr:TraB/GumN family protein [Erythrobacter sp. HKB08]